MSSYLLTSENVRAELDLTESALAYRLPDHIVPNTFGLLVLPYLFRVPSGIDLCMMGVYRRLSH
jgi:hypothetical protein